MAVIDASVYIALVNAHENEYARTWAWLEQTKSRDFVTLDRQQMERCGAIVAAREP